MADPVDRPVLPLPSAQLLLYRFCPDAEFDPARRRRSTGALGGDRDAAVRNIGAELEKGESVAAVVIEHGWATSLAELSAADA